MPMHTVPVGHACPPLPSPSSHFAPRHCVHVAAVAHEGVPLATHPTLPSPLPSRHTSNAVFAALQRMAPLSLSVPPTSMQRIEWSGAHARPYETKSPSQLHSGASSGGPAEHVPW